MGGRTVNFRATVAAQVRLVQGSTELESHCHLDGIIISIQRPKIYSARDQIPPARRQAAPCTPLYSARPQHLLEVSHSYLKNSDNGK